MIWSIALFMVRCTILSDAVRAESLVRGVNYSLDGAKSELGFHAVSFLHSFDAKVKDFTGAAKVADKLNAVGGTLMVDVDSIDTGIDKRNEEMYKILEVEKYSWIEFSLREAQLLPNQTEDGRVIETLAPGESKCALKGDLKIKGKSVPVEGRGKCTRVSDAQWIVQGEAPVNISAYGIQVPNVAFIRLDPVVTVRYKMMFFRK